MIKWFFCLLVVLSSPSLFADKIYFKIAVDENNYANFEASDSGDTANKLHFVLGKFQDNIFDQSAVKKEFYNINKKSGIKFNGKEVTVFELTPVFKDRFIHSLWVYGKENIVRREVYNIKGKLMYAFGHTSEVPEIIYKKNPEISEKVAIKMNYKGFDLKFIKRIENGASHLLFSDGVNSFSVFVANPSLDKPAQQRIVFGNNVFLKHIDNTTYTVVGGLPFAEMENVVKYIYKKGGILK